jgi:hypothetical protein
MALHEIRPRTEKSHADMPGKWGGAKNACASSPDVPAKASFWPLSACASWSKFLALDMALFCLTTTLDATI